MIDAHSFLRKRVSYQISGYAHPSSEHSVEQILKDIRTGEWAEQIGILRDLLARGEQEKYIARKKYLPGMTFSGTFVTDALPTSALSISRFCDPDAGGVLPAAACQGGDEHEGHAERLASLP